ncbi:MAG: amidohydrolase family protein [Methylobacterium sp.]|nr:amidohydrolase family protein [Methylobacterium sp.]
MRCVINPQSGRGQVMGGRREIEMIVKGGHLLTMNAREPEYPDGAVAIDATRIIAAGSRTEIEARFVARNYLDATGCVMMPGLVDAYAHAGHGMIRGLFHPESAWPSHLYWTATTPGWWQADAELAALERLYAGVTTGQSVIGATPARADDTIYSDVTAKAYAEAGLRFVLGIGPPDPIFPHLPEPFTANRLVNGELQPHRFTAEDAVERSVEVIQRWHGAADGRITAALAVPYLLGRHVLHKRIPNRVPHSSDAPIMLAHAEAMTALAREHRVAIHTHMFAGGIDFARKHFGQSKLDDILSACRIVIAHANGLPETDVEALARHRESIGIATVAFTHENLWYGFAPIPAFRGRGIPVAITTDGAAPYTSHDLWREPARTAWNQWQGAGTQSVLPPETLLGMVTIEAARVLGLADEIGSIEAGKKADLLVVNLTAPHFGGIHDLAQSLVLYANSSDVRDVVVDGQCLMRDRVPLRVNPAFIVNRARREAEAAMQRADLSPYRRPGGWNAPTDWPKPSVQPRP